MDITETGLELIERFEGYRSRQYKDAVGVPTIGFGTTKAVVNPLPLTCTAAQAEGWLKLDIEESVQPAINATGARLNSNQNDACDSLGYNLGSGVFEAGHSIGDALRRDDLKAASAAFMDYVYAGGRVLPGLVERREEERELFDRVQVPTDPHHYGWFMKWELATVKKYDALRAQQTVTSHPNRAQIAAIRVTLKALGAKVRATAIAHRVSGKPSWTLYHRGWRYQQLIKRGAGQRLV